MVMMFTIGDNRPAVAQAVHAIGSYRRTEDCRRKEQGEHLQHGAQSVHGRLDIENAQRAQAVVLTLSLRRSAPWKVRNLR